MGAPAAGRRYEVSGFEGNDQNPLSLPYFTAGATLAVRFGF
jgi:hypothetical protein